MICPYLLSSQIKEQFDDTKGVIRVRKLKRDNKCNGHKKKHQTMIYNDLQNITRKSKDRVMQNQLNTRVHSSPPEQNQVNQVRHF